MILKNFNSLQFKFLVNGVMQLGVKEIGVYLNSSIPKGEIDEHKRLNDLVFVRYDLRIQQRNLSKTRDALDNIDLLNEWICEEPNLLDGEDMSWRALKHLYVL